MVKSFKYRLRPTKKHEKILLAHIDACRILYNQLLCARIQAWQKDEESLSRYDQQDTLPMLKNQYEPFSVVHSQVLQQVCQRVDLAFKGFFRRLRERTKRKKLVLGSMLFPRNIRHKIVRHAGTEKRNHFLSVCMIARCVAIRRTETTMLR